MPTHTFISRNEKTCKFQILKGLYHAPLSQCFRGSVVHINHLISIDRTLPQALPKN
jgi:hypothetical protein